MVEKTDAEKIAREWIAQHPVDAVQCVTSLLEHSDLLFPEGPGRLMLRQVTRDARRLATSLVLLWEVGRQRGGK